MKNFITRVRIILLLILIPLFVSCSSGFLYNNLSRVTLWYIDDYVSLTSEQQKAYTKQFTELQQWHRESELKDYQLFLSDINQQVDSETLSGREIEQAVTSYHQQARTLWLNLVHEASPRLHNLTLQLSDKQKQELIHNLSEKNRSHYVKMQDMSKREWQEYKIKRLKKNLSRWIGSFTPEQKQKVQQWAIDLNPLDQGHFEYRQHWLKELASTLSLPKQQSKVRLEQLLANREALMTTAYRQKLEANRALTEKLIADLLTTRTTKQQNTLVQEIDDWMGLISRFIPS